LLTAIGGCGDFFMISITSEKFKGVPPLKQHRMVNDALAGIIKNVHGISLKTSAS